MHLYGEKSYRTETKQKWVTSAWIPVVVQLKFDDMFVVNLLKQRLYIWHLTEFVFLEDRKLMINTNFVTWNDSSDLDRK